MNDDVAGDPAKAIDLVNGALRGVIAAMAMTGMRAFTVNAGLVEQAPPQAIIRQKIPGMLRFSNKGRKKQRMLEELAHWSYGAVGGAVFAALPHPIRRRSISGPVYGLLIWLSFEAGIAPMLGLKESKKLRLASRAALAADHFVYGLVLSETRRRPSR